MVNAVQHVEAQVRMVHVEQPARRRRARMIPKEHGAYAAFLFPVLTVLLSASPTAATWLLTGAAFSVFLTHEPTKIVIGQRGTRLKREEGTRAWRYLGFYLLLAGLLGIAGLFLAPKSAQYALLLPVILSSALFLLTLEGLEKTGVGEIVVALTLSSLALPLGLSAGLDGVVSFAIVTVWALAALLGTAVVRITLGEYRGHTKIARLSAVTLTILCLVILVLTLSNGTALGGFRWIYLAAFPTVVAVIALLWLRPTVHQLRTIGWSLVVANGCTLIFLVLVLRLVETFRNAASTLPFLFF